MALQQRTNVQELTGKPELGPRQLGRVLMNHVQPKARTTAQPFMPQKVGHITEPTAQQMAARIQRVPVHIPSLPIPPIETAFVGPSQQQQQQLRADSGKPPVLLLHGFDSSCLEFRRLYPLLEHHLETWAVDLVGWGFTDNTPFAQNPHIILSPQQKREHLYQFWRQRIQKPMVLVGSSLGGAIALDFAHEHPEAVEKLVLISAQGFIDGLGAKANLPRPLAAAGVWLLKTQHLRKAGYKMAYHDPKCATEDAVRVGSLHTLMPGYTDANLAFMSSGGYSISHLIPQIQQETLVMWGRQDKILKPKYGRQFSETLQRSRLEWVEECGHYAHLEQPVVAAGHILSFMGQGLEQDVGEHAAQQSGIPLAAAAAT